MTIFDSAGGGSEISACIGADPFGGACGGGAGITAHNTWHNITYRCDGAGIASPDGCDIEAFLDGVYVYTMSPMGNIVFSANQAQDLLLGAGSEYWMDEVKFYSYAHSDRGQCEAAWGGDWDWLAAACVMP